MQVIERRRECAAVPPQDWSGSFTTAVESGRAEAPYSFDEIYHDYMLVTHGFAWSPDGSRVAVTSGAGIATVSSDGHPNTPTRGSGQGPLAWLDESAD